MRVRTFMTAALLAGSLASSASAEAGPAELALKPSQLNSDLKRYDGQTVIVKGALIMGKPKTNHLRAMYNSRSTYRFRVLFSKIDFLHILESPSKSCLTIMNPDVIWNMTERPLYRHAVLEGEFVAHTSVEDVVVGGCAIETGIWIDEVIELEGVPVKADGAPAP